MTLVAVPKIHGRSRVRVSRPSEKRSLSRSATRALDVLEMFGERRSALRALDIRTRLGLSPSSADQLLKTMVDSGHLVFDATAKSYLPSPRLARFGDWLVQMHGPDEGLGDLLWAIHHATGLIVTLSTPNDLSMQIVDFAGPQDWNGERGLRISLFGSTVGSAYLATLGSKDLQRFLRRARLDGAERTGIIGVLAQIQADGFADGPDDGGSIWSIAFSLRNTKSDMNFVIGLAGPIEQVQPRRKEIIQHTIASIVAWSGSG